MKVRNRTTLILTLAAVFIIAATLFMFGGNISSLSFPSFSFSSGVRETDSTEMPVATSGSDRIDRNATIEQSFICTTDSISQIGIVFYKIEQIENANVVIEVLDGSTTLIQGIYLAEDIESEHRTFLVANEPISGLMNKKLKIRIYSLNGADTGLGVMISEDARSSYKFNGSTRKGTICFAVDA